MLCVSPLTIENRLHLIKWKFWSEIFYNSTSSQLMLPFAGMMRLRALSTALHLRLSLFNALFSSNADLLIFYLCRSGTVEKKVTCFYMITFCYFQHTVVHLPLVVRFSSAPALHDIFVSTRTCSEKQICDTINHSTFLETRKTQLWAKNKSHANKTPRHWEPARMTVTEGWCTSMNIYLYISLVEEEVRRSRHPPPNAPFPGSGGHARW